MERDTLHYSVVQVVAWIEPHLPLEQHGWPHHHRPADPQLSG